MSLSAAGEAAVLTEEALKKLKVPELKGLCKNKKLPVSGTKPVLIARLLGQPAPTAAPSNKRKKDASTTDYKSSSTSAQQASTSQSQTTSSATQTDASNSAPKAKPQKSKAKAKVTETPVSKAAQASRDNASTSQVNVAAPSAAEPAKKKAKTTSGSSSTPIIAPTQTAQDTDVVASTSVAPTSAGPQTVPTSKSASTAIAHGLPRTSISSGPTVAPRSNVPKPSAVAATGSSKVAQARPIIEKRATPAFSVPKPKATNTKVMTPASLLGPDAQASVNHVHTPSLIAASRNARISAASVPVAKQFKTLVPTKQPILKQGVNRLDSSSLPSGPGPVVSDSRSLLEAYKWVASLLGHKSLSSLLPESIMDHEKLMRIALAYLLTKLYTLIGTAEDSSTLEATLKDLPSITNIEKCTENVSLVTCSDGASHHVLNASGEVIGTQLNRSSAGAEVQESRFSEFVVRSDWKAYLDGTKQASAPDSIFSLIRSPDEEFLQNGISKHWLAILGRMDDIDQANGLLAAARAYVPCHVAPNAVSGSWQTLSEQQAEFSGSGGASSATRARKPKVALFLPICHQVESVSFKGLHPSIAQVQTPSRAHYTLRLTGQSIGEEDEGILPIFQDMIKCDSRGRPL